MDMPNDDQAQEMPAISYAVAHDAASLSRKKLKRMERDAARAWHASSCANGSGGDDSLYWRWQEIKREVERRNTSSPNQGDRLNNIEPRIFGRPFMRTVT